MLETERLLNTEKDGNIHTIKLTPIFGVISRTLHENKLFFICQLVYLATVFSLNMDISSWSSSNPKIICILTEDHLQLRFVCFPLIVSEINFNY